MTRSDSVDPHSLASAPVVVGVDGTEASDAAVRWAAKAAARRQRELVIVHGMDLDTDGFAVRSREQTTAIGESIVTEATRLAEQTDPTAPAITPRLESGDPGQLLVDRSESAHLVVLGSPTDSVGLGRLGSILLSVVSRARGAVVVVRAGEPEASPSAPVVVGIDGSPVSDAATGVAFREAAVASAPLIAVHSWADPYAGRFSRLLAASDEPVDVSAPDRALLAERLAGWRERYPSVDLQRRVERGTPRDQLLAWSQTARLLVVGSRGRGRFARFMLGSTSATLVQRARCPVMVVHPG
ncbi:universal stress protein [Nocardia noduli]|uniref:universal stress protein n=1 Tax=Nocardia noduli TaxID=2815722 RepID=UPI001C213558|nr:universal stress protein [Nocardia noduli]